MQATQTITITILGAPLLFVSGQPGVGHAGELFKHQLAAAGGAPPYEFRFHSGQLPPGFSVRANGLITGVPTEPGDYTFTVEVTDSAP